MTQNGKHNKRCQKNHSFMFLHTYIYINLYSAKNCENESDALLYALPHLLGSTFSHSSSWKPVFYLNATHPSDHFHLCLLKCHFIFFPYRPHLTSMQHAVSHTTAVEPSSHIILIILFHVINYFALEQAQ